MIRMVSWNIARRFPAQEHRCWISVVARNPNGWSPRMWSGLEWGVTPSLTPAGA